LLDALEEQEVRLVLARVRTELRDELVAAGLEQRIGVEHIDLEVDDVVAANQPAAADSSLQGE
jgi:hypothetical protein